MYVKFEVGNTGPKIQVVVGYNDSYDMVMVLKCVGGNHIFNIATPLKIAKSEQFNAQSLGNAAPLIDNLGSSDWFGPHKVYALNNADGDNPHAGGFTGGSHNYNNNEDFFDSSSTGRTADVRIVANRTTYKDHFEGYADQIDIYWENYIQAINTRKIDGSGREVLIEHHHLTYDGTKWLTDTELEFLEDVKWVRHFGLQCINGNNWNGEIKYGDGGWLSIVSNDTNSGDKLTDTVTMRKNGHYLEMHLDNEYGIGDRRYLSSNCSGAFSRIYSGFGKSYFYLVNSENAYVNAGEILKYRGHYRFYYR